MSSIKIINNRVIYDKKRASLSDVNNEYGEVILTTPANNCLHIILGNGKNITPQKKLFEEVWEQHGIPVNVNTLYQNISIIRRAFRQLGIEDEIIVTIPRRGMALAENVIVNECPDTSTSFEEEIEHNYLPEKITDNENPKINLEKYNFSFPKEKNKRWVSISFAIITIIFSSILSRFAYQQYTVMQSRFYHYKSQGIYNQCKIFTDDRVKIDPMPLVKNRFDHLDIHCEFGERVYASLLSGFPRESLIFCDGDILSESTECRSRYRSFIGGRE